MTLENILIFTLGMCTCALCFLFFRDTYLLHLFKNAQSINISDEAKSIEKDLKHKLSIYSKVLIEAYECIKTIINNTESTSPETQEILDYFQEKLPKIEAELDELEAAGIIERKDVQND